MTDKIDRETAENEFERWADAMDLDLEAAGLDENDAKDNLEYKETLVKGFQDGSIILTENSELVFTPRRSKNTDPITFKEPEGNSWLVMDKKKKSADVGKLFTSIGRMCNQPAVRFSNLKIKDLKVCLAVYTLLMG